MDNLPYLEPIALWDGIPIKHKSAAEGRAATWTCKGRGLIRFGNTFDPNVKHYIPLADPARTKKGTIRVNQPHIAKKPADYWKAQCAFRGMPTNGSMLELQARLRANPNTEMAQDIKDLAEKSNQEFRIKNARARDDEEARLEALYVQQEADTDKFLLGEFETVSGKKCDEDKVIVVIAEDHFELHVSAPKLGLVCLFWRPWFIDFDEMRTSNNRSLSARSIIGRRRAVVEKKLAELEALEKKRSAECERKRKHDEMVREQADKDLFAAKRQKVLEAAGKNWDVVGTWKISCPYLVELYSVRGQDLTLEIFWEQTEKGPQMYAKFDFGIISGVMRFETLKLEEMENMKAKPTKGSTKIPIKEESGDESGDESDEDIYGEHRRTRSPTPEAFYLKSSVTKPSAQHPTWSYRWRGAEDEGPIDTMADASVYDIVFEEPKGTKLTGTFGCCFFEETEFTGVKVGVGGRSDVDISYEWEQRNSDAYERARVGRWH